MCECFKSSGGHCPQMRVSNGQCTKVVYTMPPTTHDMIAEYENLSTTKRKRAFFNSQSNASLASEPGHSVSSFRAFSL